MGVEEGMVEDPWQSLRDENKHLLDGKRVLGSAACEDTGDTAIRTFRATNTGTTNVLGDNVVPVQPMVLTLLSISPRCHWRP